LKSKDKLTKERIIEILREAQPYLRERYGVKRIAIFGSCVKGRVKKDSDIDILVDFERPIGLDFIDLADYLEEILGMKVDLLTPAGVKSIKRKEIIKVIEQNLIYV
jgi:hypothetical protein